MLVTCRRVLRVERSLRFFSVNLEQVPNDKIDGMQDDDYVVDQSFDVQRIRRDEDKSLRIAILGLPNAGKSTLVNQLAGRQICAMSGKAHTTRSKTNVIYSESNTQLIFMDTPGLVTNRDFKKFKLEPTFKSDITQSLELADVVGVVQDVSNPFKRHKIDERVIEALKCTRPGVFSILILNKIDRMRRKKELLKLVDILTGENNWPNFSDIFMISALKNDGVDDLRAYLMDSATNRDWDYRSNQITDESTEKIVERTVKAKFMDALPDELPYVLDIQTEHLGVLPDDSMSAVVNVDCPTDRIGKLVMGPKGSRVKQVALAAEQDLSNAFRTTVRLKIAINFKTKK
ncbi:GTPase Era, mitochondrial [Fopius arisanus]|uniref:GTPase Era, mitochondrial n=1 Tax=Fopius arisanus TaxID=64838 RepID=A0A0C9RKM2_9HYME|nr:PREDICTED: GTPase Era, mitochondrial [Fopius arisanus]XP_011307405.1 PREDICTED: GTPase Era, mitochondrial [Fopius arisanus]